MEEDIQNYLPTVMFRGTPCMCCVCICNVQCTVQLHAMVNLIPDFHRSRFYFLFGIFLASILTFLLLMFSSPSNSILSVTIDPSPFLPPLYSSPAPLRISIMPSYIGSAPHPPTPGVDPPLSSLRVEGPGVTVPFYLLLPSIERIESMCV